MRGLMVSFSRKFGSTILAVSLLCALLLVSVPVASVSANPICKLACCAGRATHAAGSCAHGSCSSDTLSRKTAHVHRKTARESDPLCGLPRRGSLLGRRTHTAPTLGTNSYTDSGNANHSSLNESARRQMSAALAARSCAPDCSRCASGFTNPNRRNSAAVTQAEHPWPQSDINFANLRQRLAQTQDASRRLCLPRGPPIPLS